MTIKLQNDLYLTHKKTYTTPIKKHSEKIMLKHLRYTAILLCVVSSILYAQDLTFVGETEQTLSQSRLNGTVSANANVASTKHITLPIVELSNDAQQVLLERAEQVQQNNRTNADQNIDMSSSSSKYVQLGMGNVPVLDQGQHGTCTTFAITAAMDAAWKKGDYISQLCLLQLGQYLSQQSYGLSGWNGAFSDQILYRIATFGVISKKNQEEYGCGGAKTYSKQSRPNSSMSPQDYKKHSTDLARYVKAIPMFNLTQTFHHLTDTQDALIQVKTALKHGNRVTFATLLPRTELGTMGAVGWHSYFNDTWVITSDITKSLQTTTKFSAHSMIITGYDDNAVAMDHSGHRHRGLLTLRNSWGSWVADWGTFYMSYDYFKTLVFEAQEIMRVS